MTPSGLPPPDDVASASGDALTRYVLEAPAHELLSALQNPNLEEKHLLLILRRRDLPASVVVAVSERPEWMAQYLVKAAIVAHHNTPKTLASSLVKFLFWRDLAKLVARSDIDSMVRKLSEVNLRDRIGQISLGEKVALARMAPREVLKALRSEANERVMAALLDNPRCTDDDVLFIANSAKTSPKILELLGKAERWMVRQTLRVAVIRNPRTPTRTSYALLAGLNDSTLRGLLDTPGLSPVIRQAAERMLGERRGSAPN